MTITIHLWWFLAYLLVGLVTLLPASYAYYRQLQPQDRTGFWKGIASTSSFKGIFFWLILWPLGIYELTTLYGFRSRRKKRKVARSVEKLRERENANERY